MANCVGDIVLISGITGRDGMKAPNMVWDEMSPSASMDMLMLVSCTEYVRRRKLADRWPFHDGFRQKTAE
jgi:hypothetical protein